MMIKLKKINQNGKNIKIIKKILEEKKRKKKEKEEKKLIIKEKMKSLLKKNLNYLLINLLVIKDNLNLILMMRDLIRKIILILLLIQLIKIIKKLKDMKIK